MDHILGSGILKVSYFVSSRPGKFHDTIIRVSNALKSSRAIIAVIFRTLLIGIGDRIQGAIAVIAQGIASFIGKLPLSMSIT